MAVCDIGAYELYPSLSLRKKCACCGRCRGIHYLFTITVINNLSVTVSSLVLTDAIPVNATYISGGTLVGNVVSWTVPELSAGSSFNSFFIVTASQTITNNDYRILASGGFSTTGGAAVVTVVVVPASLATRGGSLRFSANVNYNNRCPSEVIAVNLMSAEDRKHRLIQWGK